MKIWVSLFFLLFSISSVFAQTEENKTYTVGVSEFPPFIIGEDGKFSGFDIDYWGRVFEEAGIDVEYQNVPLSDKIEGLEKGDLDFGLGGMSITSDRESKFDFSQPYFNSGLGILVNSKDATSNPFYTFYIIDLNPQIWGALIFFVVTIFLGGLLLWFLDLGNEDGISDKFSKGLFEGSWCAWAILTTVGFGDISPKKWAGRVAAVFVGICGMLVFSSIMGTISSELTVKRLDHKIQDLSDLKGKIVSVKRGSTSVSASKENGMIPFEFDTLDEAIEQMLNGNAAAVIGRLSDNTLLF